MGIKLVVGLILFSVIFALQMYFNKSVWLKVASITILFIISSLAYFSFDTYKGWPSDERIPKSVIYDIEIIQPSRNFPGAIYVWAVPESKELTFLEKMVVYNYERRGAPRSYYVPFTKSTAKAFGDAQRKLKQGFVVTVDETADSGGGDSGNKGRKGPEKDKKNGGDAQEYDVPALIITSPDNMIRKND